MTFKGGPVLLTLLVLGACDVGDHTYTLYRNSPLDEHARIHVATFDADEPKDYNSDNCALAARLFQSQQGVTSSFWCEKGPFRK